MPAPETGQAFYHGLLGAAEIHAIWDAIRDHAGRDVATTRRGFANAVVSPISPGL